MWRKFFSRQPERLSGAPAARRLKTYSAQSGYVYQYFYEGHRPFHSGGDNGVEYIFNVSADRKRYEPVAVRQSAAAIQEWERSAERQLSASERYGIAKIALFQAFDDRTPAEMKEPVWVRRADLDSIAATLGL